MKHQLQHPNCQLPTANTTRPLLTTPHAPNPLNPQPRMCIRGPYLHPDVHPFSLMYPPLVFRIRIHYGCASARSVLFRIRSDPPPPRIGFSSIPTPNTKLRVPACCSIVFLKPRFLHVGASMSVRSKRLLSQSVHGGPPSPIPYVGRRPSFTSV